MAGFFLLFPSVNKRQDGGLVAALFFSKYFYCFGVFVDVLLAAIIILNL